MYPSLKFKLDQNKIYKKQCINSQDQSTNQSKYENFQPTEKKRPQTSNSKKYFAKPSIIVKDYNFYKGKRNLWEKMEILNPKIYNFYFKYQEDNEKISANAKEKETMDKLKLIEKQKTFVNNFRQMERERFKNRRIERKILQYESSQNMELDDNSELGEVEQIINDEMKRKQILHKKCFKIKLSNRADNLWNDYTQLNEKMVNQTITPLIIRNDEKAMTKIEQKFLLQQLSNQQKNEMILGDKNETKVNFKKRHLQNYLFEKSLGLQKINRNLGLTQPDLRQTKEDLEQEDLEKLNENPGKYFPCKFVKSRLKLNFKYKPHLSQFIANIAREKGPNYFKPGFLLQHGDYKGLLIGEIDDQKISQTQNPLIKKLLYSQVLQDNIIKIKSSRPGSSIQRPKTALSKLNFKQQKYYIEQQKKEKEQLLTKTLKDFQEKQQRMQDVVQELDNFEQKFHTKQSKHYIGFPQVQLLEAYNLTSTQGFKIEKEKRKNKEKLYKQIEQRCN